MTGGIIQLQRSGAENAYLNGNPQMTYFKSVYKHHTNFSMEAIRLDFEGTQNLAYNVETQLKCKIARNGDLINKLYFSINLPDIYSSYEKESENSDSINKEFQWLPNIGCQIIKKCTLTIGGSKISELFGQWIEIYHEIFLDTAGKNNFDKITGHDPDLFKPSNNGINAGFYPSSSLNPSENVNPDSEQYFFSEFRKNCFLQPPSIKGRQIFVPIPFWFTTNPGLALPLIALQYHEIILEFEMRPITELYTLIETRTTGNVPQKSRTAPDATLPHHHIGNFITSVPKNSFKDGMLLSDGPTNMQGWNQDCHIIANYIFLDSVERRKFAGNNHEYLIEQVNRKEFIGVTNTKSLNLSFEHPCKYLVWFGQRSDVNRLNSFNNYTNWIDEYIPPYSDAYIKLLGAETADNLYYEYSGNTIYEINGVKQTLDNDDQNNRALIPTKFNFEHYNEDIIKSSRLLFNGLERFSTQKSLFYKHLQSYQHSIKNDKSGLNFYSFALAPERFQPSGSCNFSTIHNIELEVEMNPLLPDANNSKYYDYNVYVYAVNYNLLKISSGMAGVSFSG
tara:strand:+ start:138 stop:1826 length:1689 start_codon:yes stop_codon:yes gene_type:complete